MAEYSVCTRWAKDEGRWTLDCPVLSLVSRLICSPWRSFAGSIQSYMIPLEFGWSSKGEDYFRVSPAEVNYPLKGEELHFPAGKQLVCTLASFFDEWSHYIICLLYSGPPSTFLALSMLGNNGVFVRLAKTLFLQCDPLEKGFELSNFLSEKCWPLFWMWKSCLKTRKVFCSPRTELLSEFRRYTIASTLIFPADEELSLD